MKRPAMADEPAASDGAASKKTRSVEDYPKKLPNMPKLPSDGSNPAPVQYWVALSTRQETPKRFRALKIRGDAYTEASASWGGDSPARMPG